MIHNEAMLLLLRDCADEPLDLVGGKALQLAGSLAAGLPVPPGWVVPATQFRAHLRSVGGSGEFTEVLAGIKTPDADLVKISSVIRSILASSAVPTQLANDLSSLPEGNYAVRSSASFEDGTASSWAGQFDSFLNVPKTALAMNVMRCWASCFSVRALTYNPSHFEHPEEICFAVLIQEMVEPEYSGVAFSNHPVTGSKHIYLEMVEGYGIALVSGKRPDFVAEIDLEEQRVIPSPGMTTRHVSDARLLEVARMVAGLEKAKGWSVDVEFCIGSQGLSLLQVRPLTVRSHFYQHQLPHLKDYEMTFKVTGIPLLFASILLQAFNRLDPLFTSGTEGQFKQYFTNNKMRWAARAGLEFFTEENGFTNYVRDFRKVFDDVQSKLDGFFAQNQHDTEAILAFGTWLSLLFELYSRMDIQYTNEAFANKDNNPLLKLNLERLAAFKDTARNWINSLFLTPDAPLNRFVKLMQQRYKCSAFSVENRTLEELATGSQNRSYSDARTDPYVIWSTERVVHLVSGDRAEAAISLMAGEEDFNPNLTHVRGTVANGCSEVIVGIVRVIEVDYANPSLMQASIDMMLKGEVLIAEFTAPELLLACQKAKAIVTDIGGLLSHAAIVSRELNVPCLVGTKSASKLFKTGDKVKIDFTLGVISKVE